MIIETLSITVFISSQHSEEPCLLLRTTVIVISKTFETDLDKRICYKYVITYMFECLVHVRTCFQKIGFTFFFIALSKYVTLEKFYLAFEYLILYKYAY